MRFSRRANARRLALLVVSLIVFATLYVLFIGDTRARVRLHHGVTLPSSANHLSCRGCTAFSYWIGDASEASFTIRPEDLQIFLAQFRVSSYHPNGFASATGPSYRPLPPARPWLGTGGDIASKGIVFAPSPTGTDQCLVEWDTTASGVEVKMRTMWN